jgi:hypothetical protein
MMTATQKQRLATRQTIERMSLYRTLCIHRIVLREEGAWFGESFGSKLIEQDCTKIVLRLARWPYPM